MASTIIKFRCSDEEKARWTAQAGSRTLTDYFKFLADRDGATHNGEVYSTSNGEVLIPKRINFEPVQEAKAAVAKLTPKQQKAAPVSVVGRSFSTPVSDQVDAFFKATPEKKGRR